MDNVSTSHLRILAQHRIGMDLPSRLASAQDVVCRQASALNAAADEIDSLRAMVVTLTRELEHCKTQAGRQ